MKKCALVWMTACPKLFFGAILRALFMSPPPFHLVIRQVLCLRDLRIFPPVVIGGAEIAQSV